MSPTAEPIRPVRVAVLGGGAGAVTAAFDLTDPRHGGRFEVTVYQMGWRLGGKGASGRGGPHARIEEHGLHIWFGFYENAFRCMRACYDELGRGPEVPLRTVDDAFTPARRFGVTEQRLDRWTSWVEWFPMADGSPGTLAPGEQPTPTVGRYVVQLLRLAQTLIDSHLADAAPSVRVVPPHDTGVAATAKSDVTVRVTRRRDLSAVVAAARQAVTGVGSVLDGLELAGLVAAIELASTIEAGLDRWGTSGRGVSASLDAFVDGLQDRMAEVVEEDEAGARMLELVDLIATIVRGLIADGVITEQRGFDALDNYDLRDWLYLHGGRSISVDGGLIRAIYDLVFAYRDGEAERPAFAAGQALRGMFRMFFDYRGAFAYHMQAGMGDVVFAPYYEVLRRRGVRFEFFHRVDALHPSVDGTHIESVDIVRQARVDGDTYEPLMHVHGLPCWPAEPRWEQLPDWSHVPPEERPAFESPWNQPTSPLEPLTLRAGVDFDELVYGLSLGSVPSTCEALIADRSEWAAMVANVGTVATQALQLWLGHTTAELGGLADAPVIAGYVEPLDTWADMSYLVQRERWGSECRSIHYFCSAMPSDPPPPPGSSDVQHAADEQAWRAARSFVDLPIGHFLPGSVHHYPSEFRWELLVDPEGRVGHHRLRSQFVRANIAESERYVLSLPGTDRHRLAPGRSGYRNLSLAGDWTDTGFNAGCVEAATMSGLMASAAVQQIDDLSSIHGHDHP